MKIENIDLKMFRVICENINTSNKFTESAIDAIYEIAKNESASINLYIWLNYEYREFENIHQASKILGKSESHIQDNYLVINLVNNNILIFDETGRIND